MKSALFTLYFVVCFLIIFAVFLQNGKGSQMSAAFGPQNSKNIFGASGPKNFLYVCTKWLIFLFFSMAFGLTLFETRVEAQKNQSLPWTPLLESSDIPSQETN